MQKSQLSEHQYVSALQMIFDGLLGGMVIFSFVIFFVFNNSSASSPQLFDIFIIIIPTLGIACFLASNFIFKKLSRSIDINSELIVKLKSYYTAYILKLAILEFPVMISLIAYFLTGGKIFLAFVTIFIIYFIWSRPTPAKTITTLQLNENEIRKLKKPEDIIS